ncbi:2-keto-4-pentenoate hydratase/2-oxohepta-3-ene-1,7-dioic acid hydratase in catechol pathway [Tamaricihabitans halophyticus]|uniref:2-keto-4-pentenoate hydratase/2-oxohepta-3-ene-1,7-dioic acid hydratase in catechol pathway n=1 Tax=Tamaricihabitans halophyticus TaxID=1262583 RepID=A0A4V2SV09_9PSEU|nr:fumarylacetoacetate hydrolase family protein [Tamaricihabitans halophyticus]TCP56646.1 2-keto-4-pentenoate hydratase/2-oxohepta-3-ene-1,7-dioic acid hydratase in catechol pathway [Tamaricihabitans halophyticus]
MKLATFARPDGVARLGAVTDQGLIDLRAAAELLGSPAAEVDRAVLGDLGAFFAGGSAARQLAEDVVGAVLAAREAGRLAGSAAHLVIFPPEEVQLLAPMRPRRIRDYLTYQQHATGAGVAVPPAFSAMPICYQCNVDSVIGPDEVIPWPAYTDQLDYELEIGFFVGTGGRDLSPERAAERIGGVTLFNDVSARDIQFFEMSMGIGPSKGKDFCNVLGPVVVTMDEIDEYAIELTARVNGAVWSHGTTANRQYSFAEVLAWASYGEDVYPGEFLAVGTVGGGCGAELDRWIQPGDVVELEASGIGVLRNQVGQPARQTAGLPSYQGAPRFQVPGK